MDDNSPFWQRRPKTFIILVAAAIIFVAVMAIKSAPAEPLSQQQTTFYGKDGRLTGRAATDSQGTTTYYDARGSVTGKATGPRR